MTYQGDFTLPSELLEQIAVQGFDVLPELIRIVVNAVMEAQRQVLEARSSRRALAHNASPIGELNQALARLEEQLAVMESE